MPKHQLECLQHLVDFAHERAEEVYGDSEIEYSGSQKSIDELLTSAVIVQQIIDNNKTV